MGGRELVENVNNYISSFGILPLRDAGREPFVQIGVVDLKSFFKEITRGFRRKLGFISVEFVHDELPILGCPSANIGRQAARK